MENAFACKDLFEHAVSCVEKAVCSETRWQALQQIAARASTGKSEGMVKLLKNKLQTQDKDSNIISFHCILHEERLCKAALDLKHAIDPILSAVNTTRVRTLNH